MTLPEGYVRLDYEGTHAFAIPAAEAWLRTALEEAGTLYAWAGRRAADFPLVGRGSVHVVAAPVPGPDDRKRWAVRHYLRGGAAAPLLGDRYVAMGAPRPWVEAHASAIARARGIATPAVVAGAVYPAGRFYRADLVTELVPAAADLADVVFARGTGGEAERALEAAGRTVVALEEAGIAHPDLNARNLLVRPGPEGPEIHLVDLDKCRPAGPGTEAPRGPMRERLRRSLDKIGRLEGRPLPEEAWAALARGLGESS